MPVHPAKAPRRAVRRAPLLIKLITLPTLLFALWGCRPVPQPVRPTICRPKCAKTNTCRLLDGKLLDARKPMLACIGREVRANRLYNAHQCYRALRFIESARWWYQTLTANTGVSPKVYGVPRENLRQEFFCQLEKLAVAKDPDVTESLYHKMIKVFP